MTEVHGGYKKFNSEDDDHDEKSESNSAVSLLTKVLKTNGIKPNCPDEIKT